MPVSFLTEAERDRLQRFHREVPEENLFRFFALSEVVLAQLRQEGYPVQDEDVARLSPLIHSHINLLGRYSFAVPEAVTRGELRPLRDPAVDE